MSFDEAMKISKGNREAAVFLCDWDAFCGLLDDVVDEPARVTDERLVRETLNLLVSLCGHGWPRDHAAQLLPVMLVSANAWLDANRLARSEEHRDRLSSDVLKSSYREMDHLVAYLCGGHSHMREVSANRRFDYDIPLKEAI